MLRVQIEVDTLGGASKDARSICGLHLIKED